MACETLDEEINGIQYVTTQWPATKAVMMKLKLISVFGDALFEIAQGISGTERGARKDRAQMDAFQKAINTLFKSSSPEDITNLLKEILASGHTKRDGVRITEKSFDEIFNDAGMKEMYMGCLFVIKSNYADFFKGQKAGELLAKVEENL